MPTHLPNEAALLGKAQQGDTDAFGTLVNQYYAQLFGLALKITGNREDAEDVTQDSLLKAYVNLEQFRADSRFYTWLVRITVNQALMKLRRKCYERELPWEDFFNPNDEKSPAPVEIEDSNPTPEARYAAVEIQRILSRAIVAVRPCLRKVFTLRNVEDFTVREIAQMLGLSVAAVKSRLLRARINLQRQLSVMEREFGGWCSPSRQESQKQRDLRPLGPGVATAGSSYSASLSG
jgi:RNA polymerase sigma-70 factor (ECF subfamily)